MNAETLMLVCGCGGFLLTLYWVRSRKLRERYAIGWIMVACGLLTCGLFPRAIMYLADMFRLGYATAVLFIALGGIYAFSFFVSVSLSRQYSHNVRLMQEIALLEHRLHELESQWKDARGTLPFPASAPPPVSSPKNHAA